MIKESIQKYSSEKTSINTINPIYKKINFPNDSIILDYGAGKYNSNKDYILSQNKNITFLKYDKYNCSESENQNSLFLCSKKSPNYIICSNVLNVISENDIIEEIVSNIFELADKDTEVIFVIYEGNKSGIGTVTSKGFQRNIKTANYIPLLKNKFSVKRTGNILNCRKEFIKC